MWILQLNDMRSPKSEYLTVVASADTKEALESYMQKEIAEVSYREVDSEYDTTWAKFFKKDGPLEWFNEPTMGAYTDIGTPEEAIAELTKNVMNNYKNVLVLKIDWGKYESK